MINQAREINPAARFMLENVVMHERLADGAEVQEVMIGQAFEEFNVTSSPVSGFGSLWVRLFCILRKSTAFICLLDWSFSHFDNLNCLLLHSAVLVHYPSSIVDRAPCHSF